LVKTKLTFTKIISCFLLCCTIGIKPLKPDVASDNLYFQGVATAELIDALTRGYRFTKMTSSNEREIKTLALLNCLTSAGVIATKIFLGKFEGLLFSFPNFCDLYMGIQVAKLAKKLANKNQQKAGKKTDPTLLILLALESSLSLAGKGIKGFGIGKDFEDYKKELEPHKDKYFKECSEIKDEREKSSKARRKIYKKTDKLWSKKIEETAAPENEKDQVYREKVKLKKIRDEKIKKEKYELTKKMDAIEYEISEKEKSYNDEKSNLEKQHLKLENEIWNLEITYNLKGTQKEKLNKLKINNRTIKDEIHKKTQSYHDEQRNLRKQYFGLFDERSNLSCNDEKLNKKIENLENREKNLNEKIKRINDRYDKEIKELKEKNESNSYWNEYDEKLDESEKRFKKNIEPVKEKFEDIVRLWYGASAASIISRAIWIARFIKESRYLRKLSRPSLNLNINDDENDKDQEYDLTLNVDQAK